MRTLMALFLVLGPVWAQPDPEAAPPGVTEAEALAHRGPDGPAQAFAQLAALPLGARQTIAYHRTLAVVSQVANEPTTAAEALLVLDALRKSSAEDPEAVRAWLRKQAEGLYSDAMAALAAHDASGAAKAYIRAVRAHQSVLGRDDKGLRDTTLSALKKRAEKGAPQAHASWSYGVYAYLCGQHEDAARALRLTESLETDPYLKWRAGALAAAIDAERALLKQQEVAAARKPPEASSGPDVNLDHPSAKPPPPHGDPTRRKQLEEQIAGVDKQIQYLSNDDGKYKRYTDPDGVKRKGSVNSVHVQDELGALQQKKADLQTELDGLQ